MVEVTFTVRSEMENEFSFFPTLKGESLENCLSLEELARGAPLQENGKFVAYVTYFAFFSDKDDFYDCQFPKGHTLINFKVDQ